jgi:hypothetical protein
MLVSGELSDIENVLYNTKLQYYPGIKVEVFSSVALSGM